jgi:predicted DsbA family dithiol-disulfide isomerase
MDVIEAYADIWCPFAHVGLRMVKRRRDECGRDDVPLRIHAWPLELVNERPQDAEATATHVQELRAQISPELFKGFDPATFPSTTIPALALAACAYDCSDATGEAVGFALRDALFECGHDISDSKVLASIGLSHGIEGVPETYRESVRRDWIDGQKRGVKGSPHFFCGQKNVFCPSLDIAKNQDGHLVIHRNVEALISFLDGCFRR